MMSVGSKDQTGATRMTSAVVGVGLFALVAAGLAGLAAATGWEETWAQLMQLTWGQVALLLVLSLVNYLARGLRWHLFAGKIGLPTALGQNVRHFLGGFAMTVTPGRLGELIRMRWIYRETGWPAERTAPMVLIDRASDLAAMGVLLAVAIALAAGMIEFALPVAGLALVGAFVATRPGLLRSISTLFYRLTGRAPRLWARVRTAAKTLHMFRGVRFFVPVAGLSLIGWLAEGYALYLILDWMGTPIDLWMAIAIFIFATLAGGLTGAPGGLGGAEAAMIALLTLQGVPLIVSVPATAVIRLTTLWFAIAIGAAVFPFAERAAARSLSGRPS